MTTTNETRAVPALNGTEGGVWAVHTETARYEIDLDAHTLTRYPGQGAGPAEGLPSPTVATLRRDGEVVPLIELIECTVGKPGVYTIAVRTDGIHTLRRTTTVRSIQPA